MNTQSEEHINFWTYILLIAFTAVAALITDASTRFELGNDRLIETAIIIIAGVKIILVAEYFMELYKAPLWLRGALLSWVLIVVGILVLCLYKGLNI